MTPRDTGYVLVEGHGEAGGAVGNLLARLSQDVGLPFHWSTPMRWKNLHLESGIKKGAEFIRSKKNAAALLVLRDEDDACPRDLGPRTAGWLSELALPFPSASVLLHPEYEVLFLPCIDLMGGQLLDGRAGIKEGARWDGASWEARRGVKEWLSRQFPRNRSYKPTLDQLPLTRMLDLDRVREAGVPCFATLERALAFLSDEPVAGAVYPAP